MFNQLRNFLGRLAQAQQGGTTQGTDLQGGIENPQMQSSVQSNNFNPQLMQGNIGLQAPYTSPDTSYSGGNDAQAGQPVNTQQSGLHMGTPWAGVLNLNTFKKPSAPVLGTIYGGEPLRAEYMTPSFDTNLRQLLQPVSERR